MSSQIVAPVMHVSCVSVETFFAQIWSQRGPIFQRVHQRFFPQVAKQLAFDDVGVGLLIVPGALQLRRYETEGATISYKHESFLLQDLEQFEPDREAKVSD